MLFLLNLSAMAAPGGCEDPLDAAAFDAAVDAAKTAILNDDAAGHSIVVDELQWRIPCLSFVPKPAKLAELYVGIAIVNSAQGEDWTAPLTSALHIHPDVDRLVGKRHQVRRFEAPPAPEPTDQHVPEGIRIFYDAELVSYIPPEGGYHLVQRRSGDGLESLIIIDEPIPKDWLRQSNIAVDPGWGTVAATVGVSGVSFAATPASDYHLDRSETGVGVGIVGHGLIRLGDTFRLRYRIGAEFLPDIIGEGEVAAALEFGPVAPFIGAVIFSDVIVNDEGSEWLFLVAPVLGAAVRAGRITAVAEVAAAPWAIQGRGSLSFSILKEGVSPVVGIQGAGRSLLLGQDGGRTSTQTRWNAGLQVGMAWGGAQ